MVADSPVDLHLLAQVTETSPAVMEQLLAEMAAGYAEDDRGFVLVNVAGGYRYQSHPDLTAYVERFVLEGQSARLSSAALETLAIVAYKQPISRAQVASIRGVNVDGVVRTLEQRGYIAEIARDPGPGQAVLFGTTAHVPRAHGPGLARRPAAGGRLRPRRRRGRGARGRPAGRDRRPIDPSSSTESSPIREPTASPTTRRAGRRPRRSRTEPCPTTTTSSTTSSTTTMTTSRGCRRSSTTASGCRRCWPGPGSAAGGSARTSSPRGGSRSTARSPSWVAGSTSPTTASRSTAR